MRVFLGGTWNDSMWRDIIISLTSHLNIQYFNPIVDDWDEEAQQNEIKERDICDFCLYVITPRMTGVYSIAEAVDDSNNHPEKTLFCVLQQYAGDTFTTYQYNSLYSVMKMIERNGGKSFTSLFDICTYLSIMMDK